MVDQKLTQLTEDASPTTDDLIYVVNDPGGTPASKKVTLSNLINALGLGGGLYSAYICIQDQKAQSTDGGTFTSGAWQTRVLNTEVADTGGDASISSNQITLAAGTYRCLISCPAFYVSKHQAKLYNITDTADILIGTSEIAETSTSSGTTTRSMIVGRFTIAATKVLEVQHRCVNTYATYGLGLNCGFATEIYTTVEFWKET